MKKIFLILTLTSSTIAIGQNRFSVNAGLAFPTADFAEEYLNREGSTDGGASTGINIGGKYTIPMNDHGLGVFVGMDVMYNSLTSKAKRESDLEEAINSNSPSVDITYWRYINVPITGGLSYVHTVNDNLGLFGEFGAGINILKLTKAVVEDRDERAEVTFDTTFSLAYSIRAGIIFNKKYRIGVGYYQLGSHTAVGEVVYNGQFDYTAEFDIDVSMVTVSFGYIF